MVYINIYRLRADRDFAMSIASLKRTIQINLLVAATILLGFLIFRWEYLITSIQANKLELLADAIALSIALIIILMVGLIASLAGSLYGQTFDAALRAMQILQWSEIANYISLLLRGYGQAIVIGFLFFVDLTKTQSLTRICPYLLMKFNTPSALPYLHFPLTCILLN